MADSRTPTDAISKTPRNEVFGHARESNQAGNLAAQPESREKRGKPFCMTQITEYVSSRSLQPLCSRDDHRMIYEAKGVSWKPSPHDNSLQTLPSYHCNFEGCSVRYDLTNGYFTVVNTPDMPFFVEEPGVNHLQCPQHGTWLYHAISRKGDSRFVWRCGVDGCDFVRADRSRC